MGLEDNFHQAIGEWIEHCRNPLVQNDSSESVKDCDAYRKIISMNKEALPLLRELYETDIGFYISGQNEDGEYAAFPTRNLPDNNCFMDALFAFQYGETAEESNAGFERMTQIGKDELERDLSLSLIKSYGLVSAVEEIVGGNFSVPEEMHGQNSTIEDYTKNWLDENMHKYVTAR